MRLSLTASIPLALFAPGPALAQTANDQLEMAPASNWALDYAEDSCALRRAFQAGDELAALEFRQYVPGDDFDVAIVSTTLPRTRQTPRVRFEPDSGFVEPRWPSFFGDGEGQGILYTDSLRPNAQKRSRELLPDWPDAERNAREQSVNGLTVSEIFERPVTFRIGRMSEPMEALRTCIDDLIKQWGLDPAVQRTLSRKVKPDDEMAWAHHVQANYPMDMVREVRSADVHIRLIVGTDGKPTSCTPYKHESTASFEQNACATSLRYARFKPALDANGAPVASVYATTLFYRASR